MQCDEGGELCRKAVPYAFPIGGSGARLAITCEGCGRGEESVGVERQLALRELKPGEGDGMPEDERLDADGWLEDELLQGDGAEARKVQPVEGEVERGADKAVAVQGELHEGVLRCGEELSGTEGAPEAPPPIKGNVYIRVAIIDHGQLEAP